MLVVAHDGRNVRSDTCVHGFYIQWRGIWNVCVSLLSVWTKSIQYNLCPDEKASLHSGFQVSRICCLNAPTTTSGHDWVFSVQLTHHCTQWRTACLLGLLWTRGPGYQPRGYWRDTRVVSSVHCYRWSHCESETWCSREWWRRRDMYLVLYQLCRSHGASDLSVDPFPPLGRTIKKPDVNIRRKKKVAEISVTQTAPPREQSFGFPDFVCSWMTLYMYKSELKCPHLNNPGTVCRAGVALLRDDTGDETVLVCETNPIRTSAQRWHRLIHCSKEIEIVWYDGHLAPKRF